MNFYLLLERLLLKIEPSDIKPFTTTCFQFRGNVPCVPPGRTICYIILYFILFLPQLGGDHWISDTIMFYLLDIINDIISACLLREEYLFFEILREYERER